MCYELHHFSTKHIESGTNDALQFQFRRVDKFAQSKVFGRHFVDTQSFHAVDVPGNDCFDQEFRQNVIGNTLSYSPDIIMWRSPPLIRASSTYSFLFPINQLKYERLTLN